MTARLAESIRAEAIRLRSKERKSLNEIRDILKVSKSTLSVLLREYKLTDTEMSVRKKVLGGTRIQHVDRRHDPSKSFLTGLVKLCRNCEEEKDTSCFGQNKAMRDGLQNHCRECRRMAYGDNRENHKKKSL